MVHTSDTKIEIQFKKSRPFCKKAYFDSIEVGSNIVKTKVSERVFGPACRSRRSLLHCFSRGKTKEGRLDSGAPLVGGPLSIRTVARRPISSETTADTTTTDWTDDDGGDGDGDASREASALREYLLLLLQCASWPKVSRTNSTNCKALRTILKIFVYPHTGRPEIACI